MKRLLLLMLIAGAASAPALMMREDPNATTPAFDGSANAGSMPAGTPAPPGPFVLAPHSPAGPSGMPPFHNASTTNGTPPVMNAPFAPAPVYNAFGHPAEYLNFAVTQEWVRSRWTDITVVDGEDRLSGYRVALVSGPRPVDVCGSLTYWFDTRKRVQRITLRGWTGDPAELAHYVTAQFGFAQKSERLFEKSSWGKCTGALRIDAPPRREQINPNEQFMLLLEIVDPSSWLSLSEQTSQILRAMESGPAGESAH
jgi:hypothetical protein